MIELIEGRYFIGIWFLAYKGFDVLFTIFTDQDHSKPCVWNMKYRFRYYDSDEPGNEPFSGKDRKRFYEGTSGLITEQEAQESVETAINIIAGSTQPVSKTFCPLYSSNARECAETLMKQPWAHAKEVSKEEYEKDYQ